MKKRMVRITEELSVAISKELIEKAQLECALYGENQKVKQLKAYAQGLLQAEIEEEIC